MGIFCVVVVAVLDHHFLSCKVPAENGAQLEWEPLHLLISLLETQTDRQTDSLSVDLPRPLGWEYLQVSHGQG